MSPAGRIIIGITGASGVLYGVRLLELLRPLPIETHLVISRAAEVTLAHELGTKTATVAALADFHYRNTDISAPIASGSFKTIGMIVAPCSVRSMSEIATGTTSSLLTRAADVVLKEKRRLVLMVRETPLHFGHLTTMTHLAAMGAVIAPPVPAFYASPTTLEEMVHQTLGRILDLFDIEGISVHRWGDTEIAGSQ